MKLINTNNAFQYILFTVSKQHKIKTTANYILVALSNNPFTENQ